MTIIFTFCLPLPLMIAVGKNVATSWTIALICTQKNQGSAHQKFWQQENRRDKKKEVRCCSIHKSCTGGWHLQKQKINGTTDEKTLPHPPTRQIQKYKRLVKSYIIRHVCLIWIFNSWRECAIIILKNSHLLAFGCLKKLLKHVQNRWIILLPRTKKTGKQTHKWGVVFAVLYMSSFFLMHCVHTKCAKFGMFNAGWLAGFLPIPQCIEGCSLQHRSQSTSQTLQKLNIHDAGIHLLSTLRSQHTWVSKHAWAQINLQIDL